MVVSGSIVAFLPSGNTCNLEQFGRIQKHYLLAYKQYVLAFSI